MIDPFVVLAPVLLLAVIALLRFVGCDAVFGLGKVPPQTGRPTLDPPRGLVPAGQQVSITNDPNWQGATIYYTTDGSDPATIPPTGTTQIYNNVPITVSTTTTIKAIALATDFSSSDVVSGTYTIPFVQSNYATPQTPQSSVTVPYLAVQKAGNLNVVVVGWNDITAKINSVTDTQGNPYTLAVGPTMVTDVPTGRSGTQAIYYAVAAAGANAVTVQFSVAANFPDIRILEYTGLDKMNPLDVTAANTGISALSDSGAAQTTNANDLIFAANVVEHHTIGPGTGFTSRVNTASGVTEPDGDIAEDMIVSQTGSYNATAPLNTAGFWIMQLVAFRAASVP